ncbi:zinc-dependent alcohol dehydrogenase [Arthrobacter mobilis]|uniref:zinc-dependent alcohol dehydrogenase n=1 Tax=Arthrobacter mobilis TaxID=2724944 RepID=UPI002483C52F
MLVEVVLCGVDGSELHMYKGEMAWVNEQAPVVFGDEIIGRVSSIGADAKACRGLDVGDLVTVESRWPCEGCRTCDTGQYYLCEKRNVFTGYGTLPMSHAPGLWGGYATHVFVPEYALAYKVPEGLSERTALIACSPLANGIRWVEKGGTKPGDHVAVIGPGTQGLACALAAVRLGAKVTLIGLEADCERLEVAKGFGVFHTVAMERGETVDVTIRRIQEAAGDVDVVVETAGAGTAKKLALELVRPLGTVVNVSVTTPAEQPVDWPSLIQREVTLVNPLSHPGAVDRAFELAQELLADGIDIGEWITHVYGLEEADKAIEAAAYKLDVRPVKVALQPR